ncbi:MAG TPA: polysaccharide biosynthesis/export family protein [Terriglobales bacterium]|nr:polysaccharide biosynthesis/export family protein [Terriglobales bacterium]
MKRITVVAGTLATVALALSTCIAQDVDHTMVASAASSGASANTSTTNSKAEPQFSPREPRYQIRPGDTFDVSFELSPEFNQTVAVQPDGFVTLKSVGDVKVGGQTVPQLTDTLKKAYSTILNDPQIVVVLKDFEKPYFTAGGQVGKPGKYEMRGDITLSEAIEMAGGFTDNAKHSQVLLFRRVDDQWTSAKIFNVKEMLKKGNLHEDPTLQPGDMLVVPKNALSKIKAFIPNTGVGAYAQLPTVGR